MGRIRIICSGYVVRALSEKRREAIGVLASAPISNPVIDNSLHGVKRETGKSLFRASDEHLTDRNLYETGPNGSHRITHNLGVYHSLKDAFILGVVLIATSVGSVFPTLTEAVM